MSKHTVTVTIGFTGHTEQEDAKQAVYELLTTGVADPRWKGHGTNLLVVGNNKEVQP